jgi:hypothetical protein
MPAGTPPESDALPAAPAPAPGFLRSVLRRHITDSGEAERRRRYEARLPQPIPSEDSLTADEISDPVRYD